MGVRRNIAIFLQVWSRDPIASPSIYHTSQLSREARNQRDQRQLYPTKG